MFEDISKELAKYSDRGETVAVAQVVWRKVPTSGKPGDKAIISKNGMMTGWIGGGCVRSIAIKEAYQAIKDRKYRIVRISPDLEEGMSQDPSIKTYKMVCHGGGSMEIFIEPVMPKPHIIVIGNSNISAALVKISKATDYKVSVLGRELEKEMFPEADNIFENLDFKDLKIGSNTFIIVATQGENDEEAVKNALLSGGNYVSLVASPKKAQHVKDYLFMNKVKPQLIDTLRTPAGLNINAKLPEEVAISILADIIKNFRSENDTAEDKTENIKNDLSESYFINPVCNLPISKVDAKHIVDYKGHKVYFCCDGCKISFDKTPDHYIDIMEKMSAKG